MALSYWIEGALSTVHFLILKSGCLLWVSVLSAAQVFSQSVCELIWHQESSSVWVLRGFSFSRYSIGMTESYLLSHISSGLLHSSQVLDKFLHQVTLCFHITEVLRLWILNISEFTQETLFSCCLLCFYPALGPTTPGSYPLGLIMWPFIDRNTLHDSNCFSLRYNWVTMC